MRLAGRAEVVFPGHLGGVDARERELHEPQTPRVGQRVEARGRVLPPGSAQRVWVGAHLPTDRAGR